MFIWCQFQIYTLWCHNYPIHHKNPERNWTKRLKTHFLVTYWLFNKDVKQWRYGIKLQRVPEFCSADIVYHLASMGECSFLFTIGNNHPKYSFLTKHHSFNVHLLVWKHEIDLNVQTCIQTTALISIWNKPIQKRNRRGAVGRASDSWSVDTCQSWVRAPWKAPVVSLSKKLYSHCLVLVGYSNGFEGDLHKQIIACFTLELKKSV